MDLRAPSFAGRVRSVSTRERQPPTVGLLHGLPLFTQLSDAHANFLATRSAIQAYARGARVVAQGQSDNSVFIMISGKAYAMRTGSNGRDLLQQVLERGDHFGEMCLIDGEPHTATVRCVTPCRILVIDGQDFNQCLMNSPALSQTLTQSLVSRLRQANRRITSLALQDVRDRVISQLNEVSEVQDGARVLRQSVSRTELAQRVGASREMVSRILKSLTRAGVIVTRPDGSMHLVPQATS